MIVYDEFLGSLLGSLVGHCYGNVAGLVNIGVHRRNGACYVELGPYGTKIKVEEADLLSFANVISTNLETTSDKRQDSNSGRKREFHHDVEPNASIVMEPNRQDDEYCELDRLIRGAMAANKARTNNHPSSPSVSAEEFRTVKLDIGRGAGYTTWIVNNAGPDDVILVPSEFTRDIFVGLGAHAYILNAYYVSNVRLRSCNVFVDQPSAVIASIGGKTRFYETVAECSQIVMLGQ